MTEQKALEALLLSDRDMLLLCDPGEVEHVCRLLVDSPAPLGLSLGPLVIKPLTKIINATEGNSLVHCEAVALRDHVEILASLIRMEPASASEFAVELRMLWLAFIVAMSASRIYHDLPKSRAQQRDAGGKKRPGRSDPLREKVKNVLAGKRQEGCQLLDALKDWQCGLIDGLKLKYVAESDSYLVDDENSTNDDRPFTTRQIKSLWTEAGVILPR